MTIRNVLVLIVIIIATVFAGAMISEKNTKPDMPNVETASGNAGIAGTSGIQDSLDLSEQGLKAIPDYVLNKTTLRTLNVSRNNLTGAIPAEIRFLKNLRVLDLSDNKITGLPAELGQLNKLETLDVSNNFLTGLPLELGNLTQLKVLNLSGNDYSKYDLGLIRQKLPGTNIITD